MLKCPHCGAESADSSTFCSLCLAGFDAGGAPPRPAAPSAAGPGTAAAAPPQQQAPAYPPPQQPPQQQEPGYAAPSDYHALSKEMESQPNPYPGYRDSAFYNAAMGNPNAISAVGLPQGYARRSTGDILILVLKYSIIMYFLIGAANIILALIAVGAALGAGMTGFSVGLAVLILGDALMVTIAGYWISARAGERGKGWIYGLACVAAIIFFWQPLFGLFAYLIFSGMYVPVFNLYGVFAAIFLYLPLGALGGWIAEKRYMG